MLLMTLNTTPAFCRTAVINKAKATNTEGGKTNDMQYGYMYRWSYTGNSHREKAVLNKTCVYSESQPARTIQKKKAVSIIRHALQ